MKQLITAFVLFCTAQAFASDAFDNLALDANLNGEVLVQQQNQQFQRSRAANPGNAIYQLPQRRDLLELRPDILLSADSYSLNLKPRISFIQEQIPDPSGGDLDNNDHDTSLRYWHLDLSQGDYWLKAGRYVNIWGPARLISASNRYHTDNGQSNPNIELLAREYLEFGRYLGQQWQIGLTANIGKGQQQLENNNFTTTGELRLSWLGEAVNINALLVNPESGWGLGGYGQWTINDALILYGDALYLNKDERRQSLLDTGIEHRGVEGKRNDTFTTIAGLSYTFASGLNLTLDYYGSTAGLDREDTQALLHQGQQLTAAALNGQADSQDIRRLTTINRLPFYQLGRHYLLSMVQRNNVWNNLDITGIAIANLEDNSRQYSLNVEYRWLDTLTLYAGSNQFIGGELTEFGRFLDSQHVIGFKFFW